MSRKLLEPAGSNPAQSIFNPVIVLVIVALISLSVILGIMLT